MELSALKNRSNHFPEVSQNYSSVQPERDIQRREDVNCTVHDYGAGEDQRKYEIEPHKSGRHNEKNMSRSSGRKAYHYQGQSQNY